MFPIEALMGVLLALLVQSLPQESRNLTLDLSETHSFLGKGSDQVGDFSIPWAEQLPVSDPVSVIWMDHRRSILTRSLSCGSDCQPSPKPLRGTTMVQQQPITGTMRAQEEGADTAQMQGHVEPIKLGPKEFTLAVIVAIATVVSAIGTFGVFIIELGRTFWGWK